jgi:hypothetical protein
VLTSIIRTLIKAYLSSAILKTVDGLRKLVLFVVMVFVSAMMCCFSVFAGVAYLICQYKIGGSFVFDGFVIFCSIVFIVSLMIFLKLMCKKYWRHLLRVESLYNGGCCK